MNDAPAPASTNSGDSWSGHVLSSRLLAAIISFAQRLALMATSAPASIPPSIVSAPGKVLLAGGYLVLDPQFSGIVVSTSARFYTVIRDTANSGRAHQITVRSPQFIDATWSYDTIYSHRGEVGIRPAVSKSAVFPSSASALAELHPLPSSLSLLTPLPAVCQRTSSSSSPLNVFFSSLSKPPACRP